MKKAPRASRILFSTVFRFREKLYLRAIEFAIREGFPIKKVVLYLRGCIFNHAIVAKCICMSRSVRDGKGEMSYLVWQMLR